MSLPCRPWNLSIFQSYKKQLATFLVIPSSWKISRPGIELPASSFKFECLSSSLGSSKTTLKIIPLHKKNNSPFLFLQTNANSLIFIGYRSVNLIEQDPQPFPWRWLRLLTTVVTYASLTPHAFPPFLPAFQISNSALPMQCYAR